MKLPLPDLLILGVYLACVVGIGIRVKRRATRGIESYFLGARQLPWWMIAMAGSSSYFDITGTMWIVSMFVAYGFCGYWIQWMWGFLIAAFFFAYMGKWIRRSGVLTGAEWMVLRFGRGPGGEAARLAYTLFAVLTLTAFIGYTAVGMGKFGVEFLPVNQWLGPRFAAHSDPICAAGIIGITGAYVIMGGFVGLTIVEFIQTIILTCGALMIAYLGFAAFDGAKVASAVASLAVGENRLVQVEPGTWYTLMPSWRIANDRDMYAWFGLVVLTFVAKGFVLGASGPEQLYDFQKFLATRNPREASLAGMLWGVVHTIRFPMAMAIAVLGLVVVAGRTGTKFDPEKVLPHVIAHVLPIGLRGLALAALLSAFMATFSAMVNGAASYLIRDIYQHYIYPAASERHLVTASKIASVLMILVGIAISFVSSSINTMITWILGFLGSAILVPNALRWYWWRLNGSGFAAGMFTGMVLSLAQALAEQWKLIPAWPVYVVIPLLAGVSTLMTVCVSLLTPATDVETLAAFYRTTQPAGAWGPVLTHIRREQPDYEKEQAFGWDVLNVLIGLPWLFALYVGPSYVVVHRWTASAACLTIVVLGAMALRQTWYRRLPPARSGPA